MDFIRICNILFRILVFYVAFTFNCNSTRVFIILKVFDKAKKNVLLISLMHNLKYHHSYIHILFLNVIYTKLFIKEFIIFFRKYRLHHKPTQLHTNIPYPSVSIIKPLMGVDPHLLTNLETFFTMNYPKVRTYIYL